MVRVSFIGAGRIGQTIIYATLMSGAIDEAIVMDIVPNVPDRMKDELMHALSAEGINTRIIATNSIDKVENSDIILISAGKPRTANQSRVDLFMDNARIISGFAKILPSKNPNALYIMVTNPVDMMASVFMKYSGKYTISSGAQVENNRLRSFIADKLGVPVNSVNGYTGGEHGEGLSIFWDTISVNGRPFDDIAKGRLTREEVSAYVKGIAAQIIGTLGGTSWGPATTMRDVIVSIAKNEHKVMSIAPPMKVKDEIIHVSRPTVVGNPIGPSIEKSLSDEDRVALESAAEKMYSEYKELLTNFERTTS
ncbi:malate dehydrogenase [Candidatus Parvarchaeota archaeon]|nr:malate dehydrogenase [Candidatus Parvarchaeota archaeon]